MEKIGNNVKFLIYSICFLCIFNIALTFRIPIVLPVIGLFALCFVPGFLLCNLFAIQVTDYLENFLYYIGISIVFDILIGLVMNTVYPILGYTSPLSSQNQQIWFSIIFSLLIIFIIYFKRIPVFSVTIPNLLKKEKLILIFGSIIVTLFQIGTYLINQNSINSVLIFAIFLIPVLLTIIIIYHDDSISRIYPFILYMISYALVMELALRSNYLIGVDTHDEYYFFYTTLSQAIWSPDLSFLLSATLAISILPTMFENFLKIDPQLLFKILFPLLFSLCPLIVFVIVKRYTNAFLAFIATFFFTFQQKFIITTTNSRTSMAILFFALAVLVLCDKELSNAKKYGLISLFIIGTIFSHYTTSIIFLIILLAVFVIDLIISKPDNWKRNRFINSSLLLFFAGFLFFWYQQIISIVFHSGLTFTINRFSVFLALLNNDVTEYKSKIIIIPSVFLKYANYTRYIMYIFIGIGVFFAIYRYFQKEIPRDSIHKFSSKIDKNVVYLGIISLFLLLCTAFIPTLFFGYDTSRVNEMIYIVLPIFLVTGTCIFLTTLLRIVFPEKKFARPGQPLINFIKPHQKKIVAGVLLFLVIPQLIVVVDIDNQYSGGPYSLMFNSPKYARTPYSDAIAVDQYSYTYDQDARALQWFNGNSYMDALILSDDAGTKKIISLTGRKSMLNRDMLLDYSKENIFRGYIFISVTNEYYNKFISFQGFETEVSSLNDVLDKKNKIFSNGAVVYK